MKSICLALAIAVSSPALAAAPAANAPAAPAADPAAVAAAERLMDAMNYDKLMDQMTDAMVAQFRQSVPAQIDRISGNSERKIPDDLKDKLIGIMITSLERSIKANKAEFRRASALIYARHFTVAEIDRMTEIQKDPVMLKMQAKMPAIMTESMAMTQTAMAEEMPRMLEDVKKMIAEYIEAHPDNQAPAAPAT